MEYSKGKQQTHLEIRQLNKNQYIEKESMFRWQDENKMTKYLYEMKEEHRKCVQHIVQIGGYKMRAYQNRKKQSV